MPKPQDWRLVAFPHRPRAKLVVGSRNRKTGGIPTSMTSRDTCPLDCPWNGKGCYAANDILGHRWLKLDDEGDTWEAFCASVAALPPGQLWRHNVAGDLPGRDREIDVDALLQLVEANVGRRGFTYTHKPVRDACEAETIRSANHAGLVVNFSADTLEGADRLAARGLGPVVITIPLPYVLRHKTVTCWRQTPAGRRIVVCPAVASKTVTCATCGLCAQRDREVVVGFPAHGNFSWRITERLIQPRLLG